MTIAEEAKKGQREGLRAMRDKLADAMDDAPPAVVAQVAGQLRAVLADLAVLERGTEKGLADVLAERRAARVAAAKPSAPARVRRNKRGG